jgi:hypothetical protein
VYYLVDGLESRKYGRRDLSRWPCGTLCQQKLAITFLTSGCLSVGIVRSRAQVAEFSFSFFSSHSIKILWKNLTVPWRLSSVNFNIYLVLKFIITTFSCFKIDVYRLCHFEKSILWLISWVMHMEQPMEWELAGKFGVLGGNLPQCNLARTTNPPWLDLILNPGRAVGKPATSRQSCAKG